jgi:uncharacterized protein (DUF2141 family)
MRKAILTTLLLWAASTATAQDSIPGLTVEVTGADPATGSIEVTVFASAETFLKTAYVQRSGAVSEDGSFTAQFPGLTDGVYAVAVVHDANDNKKLDNGILGFGAESFAYSNGASNPLFGRADFEDAQFEVAGPTRIEITLD